VCFTGLCCFIWWELCVYCKSASELRGIWCSSRTHCDELPQFVLHCWLTYSSDLKPAVLQIKHCKRHWALLVAGGVTSEVTVSFVCMCIEMSKFAIEAESMYRQQHMCRLYQYVSTPVRIYISIYVYRSVRVYTSTYLHQHIYVPISTCLHQYVSTSAYICTDQYVSAPVRIYISIYVYRSVRVYTSTYLHQHISVPISTCLHR
jgi:hypothetical protein